MNDGGLETLLAMDGSIVDQDDGYWFEIHAWAVEPSSDIPHGIRYSLTLHNPYGTRLMGYDNAHAVKLSKKFKFAGHRLPYDHRHRHAGDKGILYEFVDAYQLLSDFIHRGRCCTYEREGKQMTTMAIGIMPQEKIRERLLAIAKGVYQPARGEPKIWFTSMKSLSEILSDDNRALLRVIKDQQPSSISSLAEMTGRKPGNLSRTLNTMARYGIVEMHKEQRHVRPIVKSTEFRIIAS